MQPCFSHSVTKIGEPSFTAVGLKDIPACVDELLLDLFCAGVDDAGAEELAAILQIRADVGGKTDDDIGDNVGNHHVIAAADGSFQLLVAEDIAGADGVNVLRDAVEGGIFVGDGLTLFVDIAGESAACAETKGCDGEDAAAAAEIQHGLAAMDVTLQSLEAKAGGGVAACAEGETGIEDEGHATLGVGSLPFGDDQQTLADLHGLIELARAIFTAVTVSAASGASSR